jgi:hypothetical protein
MTGTRVKWNEIPLTEKDTAKINSVSMAAFIRTIAPEEWLVLEQLSARTRNGILKRCLRLMFRAKGRAK